MILNLSLYSIFGFIILLLISKLSYKLNLVDMPSKRKVHFKPTAYTGGLALCFIYIVSTYIFNFSSQKLDLILSISLFIAITGFVDDKYNLNIELN